MWWRRTRARRRGRGTRWRRARACCEGEAWQTTATKGVVVVVFPLLKTSGCPTKDGFFVRPVTTTPPDLTPHPMSQPPPLSSSFPSASASSSFGAPAAAAAPASVAPPSAASSFGAASSAASAVVHRVGAPRPSAPRSRHVGVHKDFVLGNTVLVITVAVLVLAVLLKYAVRTDPVRALLGLPTDRTRATRPRSTPPGRAAPRRRHERQGHQAQGRGRHDDRRGPGARRRRGGHARGPGAGQAAASTRTRCRPTTRRCST